MFNQNQALIFASVVTLLTGCAEPNSSKNVVEETANSAQPTEWAVRHVDAEGAADLLNELGEIIVLDVRTPEEYHRGHVADARLVDFYDDDFADQLAKLNRDDHYLIYCGSGGRSTKTLTVMRELGFKTVTHLDGGFKAWQNANLPSGE